MHWVLVANGECFFGAQTRDLLLAADHLVSVDGGGRHVHQLGLTPHLAVGDMDSIPVQVLDSFREQGVEMHMHPPRKDATDLELALELALEHQASRVTIVGGFGNRLDHTLGNLFLLARCLEQGVSACLWDVCQSAWLTNTRLEIEGRPGDTVSVLPLCPEARGVTLRGFEYPLDQAVLTFGSTRGVSNVLASTQGVIDVESGLLAVLHQH